MQEGIASCVTEENIAEFLIDEGYPSDVIPISCILTGARAYGLETESKSRDYVGIHLMSSHECLQHPDFRRSPPVIRKQFTEELEEVSFGNKEGISLDSFEMWKFLDLLRKGSSVVYEILYMPEIHHDPNGESFIIMMREGLTNKIGKTAKNIALHDWRRKKRDKRKTVMAYFRLLQAIHYLREEIFQWDAKALWDYVEPKQLIEAGHGILDSYLVNETRHELLSEESVAQVGKELERLLEEVDRAMVATRLPNECPENVLKAILSRLKRTRESLI